MNSLAEHISKTDLAERIFTEHQLKERLGGSDARRYGLVNRALKDGALLRLKRGLYMLNDNYRDHQVHPFAAAQALMPGSYVSFETALAFHGWIPEAVHMVSSVHSGRKTLQYEAPPLGAFTFHPLALHDYQFLAGVERQKMGHLTALVAQPLRALMDLVALRKQSWAGLEWLTQGMRIEQSTLTSLRGKDFERLKPVYKHKTTQDFLKKLETSVMALKSAKKGSPSND
jgi:hypothetical protein